MYTPCYTLLMFVMASLLHFIGVPCRPLVTLCWCLLIVFCCALIDASRGPRCVLLVFVDACMLCFVATFLTLLTHQHSFVMFYCCLLIPLCCVLLVLFGISDKYFSLHLFFKCVGLKVQASSIAHLPTFFNSKVCFFNLFLELIFELFFRLFFLEFVFELICPSFWICLWKTNIYIYIYIYIYIFSFFLLLSSIYIGANLVVYDKSFTIES